MGGFVNLGNASLAGRVAFEWRARDGYVENLNPSQQDELYAQDQLGIRASLRWRPTDGVTFDLTPTVTHRSRIFFEVPNNPRISQGKVTLLNARAGVSLADDRFEVAGFVRNATNKDYLLDAGNTGGAFGIATFIPGEPRFYGVSLTARY